MSQTPQMKLSLQEAGERDIPLLAKHHRKMFEEMWEINSQIISSSTGDEIENAYTLKLRAEMPAGTCKSWLFRDQDNPVASGAISIVSFVPTPFDMSSKVAYLHSVYTDEKYRGNRLAQRIAEKAVAYCKANGIKRVILNASDAGRRVYERIGFVPSPETMRLFIE